MPNLQPLCPSIGFCSWSSSILAFTSFVGKLIAEKAIKKGIKNVVFDRGGYIYHGRIKNLAESARDGGLKF